MRRCDRRGGPSHAHRHPGQRQDAPAQRQNHPYLARGVRRRQVRCRAACALPTLGNGTSLRGFCSEIFECSCVWPDGGGVSKPPVPPLPVSDCRGGCCGRSAAAECRAFLLSSSPIDSDEVRFGAEGPRVSRSKFQSESLKSWTEIPQRVPRKGTLESGAMRVEGRALPSGSHSPAQQLRPQQLMLMSASVMTFLRLVRANQQVL